VIRMREPSVDDRIDQLLIEWHQHVSGYRHTAGHRATASSGGDSYQTPTHHDHRNGAEDARAEQLRVRGICEAMDAVRDRNRLHFYALQAEAHRLATGHAVWSVAVLPPNREERRVLVQEARNAFAREIIKRKDTIG